MKKLISLILVLTLLMGLCSCSANNNLSQEKLRGTWSIDISMNALLAVYCQPINAAIGFGDLSCLVGSLVSDYTIPFLLVFDGQSSATAYLDIGIFNARMLTFSQYLLTENILLQILGLENKSAEQISTALGGLDITRLIDILQLQLSSDNFALNLAQYCGYKTTDKYVVIPITDSYYIDGNRLMIGNGYLEYNGAELMLTENDNLTTIGFNLETSPLTFQRVSGKTDY